MTVMDRAFLRSSLALWTRRKHYRANRLAVAKRDGNATRIAHWRRLTDQAQYWIDRRRSQLNQAQPLRIRALNEARKLIGTMEHGSNNRGAAVEKIIAEGGGLPGQAWCGWFAAAAYKRAGSRAVEWRWGAVRLLSAVSGVTRTTNPLPGDLVRYKFDHVGLFEKDNGDGTISAIEGNTGASGAVSDSTTGGDGVYRKIRNKSQVADYLRVTR